MRTQNYTHMYDRASNTHSPPSRTGFSADGLPKEDVFPKCISGCPSSKQESLFRLTPTADVCNRIAYTNQCYSYECAKRCSRKPRSTPILVPSPPPLIASPKHSDLVLGHLQVHQKVLWQVESILQQSGCLSARRGSCQDQVAEVGHTRHQRRIYNPGVVVC